MKIELTMETSNPSVSGLSIKSLHKTNDKIIAVWELEERNPEYPHTISCTGICYAFSLAGLNLPFEHYVIGKQDDVKFNKPVIKIGNESELSAVLSAATPVKMNGSGSSSQSVSGPKPINGWFASLFAANEKPAAPALEEKKSANRLN